MSPLFKKNPNPFGREKSNLMEDHMDIVRLPLSITPSALRLIEQKMLDMEEDEQLTQIVEEEDEESMKQREEEEKRLNELKKKKLREEEYVHHILSEDCEPTKMTISLDFQIKNSTSEGRLPHKVFDKNQRGIPRRDLQDFVVYNGNKLMPLTNDSNELFVNGYCLIPNTNKSQRMNLKVRTWHLGLGDEEGIWVESNKAHYQLHQPLECYQNLYANVHFKLRLCIELKNIIQKNNAVGYEEGLGQLKEILKEQFPSIKNFLKASHIYEKLDSTYETYKQAYPKLLESKFFSEYENYKKDSDQQKSENESEIEEDLRLVQSDTEDVSNKGSDRAYPKPVNGLDSIDIHDVDPISSESEHSNDFLNMNAKEKEPNEDLDLENVVPNEITTSELHSEVFKDSLLDRIFGIWNFCNTLLLSYSNTFHPIDFLEFEEHFKKCGNRGALSKLFKRLVSITVEDYQELNPEAFQEQFGDFSLTDSNWRGVLKTYLLVQIDNYSKGKSDHQYEIEDRWIEELGSSEFAEYSNELKVELLSYLIDQVMNTEKMREIIFNCNNDIERNTKEIKTFEKEELDIKQEIEKIELQIASTQDLLGKIGDVSNAGGESNVAATNLEKDKKKLQRDVKSQQMRLNNVKSMIQSLNQNILETKKRMRTEPIGQDRFFNNYWCFRNVLGKAESESINPYFLFIEHRTKEELQRRVNKNIEKSELRRKWSVICTEEQLNQLSSLLNPLGHRENFLSKEINLRTESILLGISSPKRSNPKLRGSVLESLYIPSGEAIACEAMPEDAEHVELMAIDVSGDSEEQPTIRDVEAEADEEEEEEEIIINDDEEEEEEIIRDEEEEEENVEELSVIAKRITDLEDQIEWDFVKKADAYKKLRPAWIKRMTKSPNQNQMKEGFLVMIQNINFDGINKDWTKKYFNSFVSKVKKTKSWRETKSHINNFLDSMDRVLALKWVKRSISPFQIPISKLTFHIFSRLVLFAKL
eukprot:TRINITY_DN3341_c0_g2_i2.p1 TRINITY_DN3341_c0_g2~~TRINITY_DN3341_c0_g2_i2.p1  ORF type:complete len:1127 (-),score=339.55 TRINITY_DN3341_c0_g2_i2:336-3284(-)